LVGPWSNPDDDDANKNREPTYRLMTDDDDVGTLRDRIATPEGKRRYVRSLFATIADRYDLITVVLSYGQDRRWKRRLIELASIEAAERVLDVATGTGDIAFAAQEKGARVVGLDITSRMIELARQRNLARSDLRLHAILPGYAGFDVRFLVGDMLALPFRDTSFEIVTTGYGLRNVPDLSQAIDEIRRVLTPGGRLLSLDFNRPANAMIRAAYLAYLTTVGGALGWILHRDPDTYRYIPASIRQYPGAAGVAKLMESRGFRHVRAYPVLGGLMTIHHAIRS
jgi:demethylmenaquinone methyltransferase / 2-methoxy-6-polyprenyl-1,4-benzoquinol methylase